MYTVNQLKSLENYKEIFWFGFLFLFLCFFTLIIPPTRGH